MPVEFISAINVRPGDELRPDESGPQIAPDYLTRYARTLEDAGFDYTLVPYSSTSPDSFIVATAVAGATERLKPIVAVRPNTVHPLVAAQQLATLDQLSGGRVTVHVISGGSDAEQARQGDYLGKDDRYGRSAEWIRVLRRAWTEKQPFSHEGVHYRFDGFGPGLPPHGATIPVSVGGSSEAAYEVGGALGDVFGLWGEPLADTRQQIARIADAARRAGRVRPPRTWVTFRPIVAATDELAWDKARRRLAVLADTFANRARHRHYSPDRPPTNVGSQRLLDAAARGETHDRALWTEPARVTNAAGASTALVGSYETVAAAILDYIDLGADLVSIRGYDNLNDAIDYGRYVIPLVRQELAHREQTGQHGSLQASHPGLLAATR